MRLQVRRALAIGLTLGCRTASSMATAAIPSVELNDGTLHPLVGYGTYKVGVVPASASSAVAAGSTDTEAVSPADCVARALGLGYRFVDCAEFYANEAAVGQGIAASGIERSSLYLASKVRGPKTIYGHLLLLNHP